MKISYKYLALYIIPYFYFAMWRDITHKLVWPYIAVVVWLLALRICLGRKDKVITSLAGLALTSITSVLCIAILHHNQLYKWSAYFGSFFPYPLILIIPVMEILIHEIKKLK